MAFRTEPPSVFLAARRDHLRRQCPVARRMPLRRDLGNQRGQVVEPSEHLMAGTVRATRCRVGPGVDRRLPFMAQRAPPPDPPVAVRRDLLRRQGRIACRIPLGGNLGIAASQIVLARHDLFARTDRASCAAVRPGDDSRLPDVAVCTLPPYYRFACMYVSSFW